MIGAGFIVDSASCYSLDCFNDDYNAHSKAMIATGVGRHEDSVCIAVSIVLSSKIHKWLSKEQVNGWFFNDPELSSNEQFPDSDKK